MVANARDRTKRRPTHHLLRHAARHAVRRAESESGQRPPRFSRAPRAAPARDGLHGAGGGTFAVSFPTGMSVKGDIEKLRAELERHNRLYYLATPEISDYDFDQLMRRLQDLEAKHPEFADPNSPSQRVGGAPIEEFKSVIHDPPMLSIDNAYSLDELREWDARVKRGLGIEEVEYEVELKIDGVSIDLLYENGELTRGATRGDGVRGDDVTPNVRTVRALPLKIAPKFPRLEVRGEIYIAKSDFATYNAQLEEAGE